MNKIKIAIMSSGNGSNAENIIKFCMENPHLYEMPIVICDNQRAKVLDRCQKYPVEVVVIPPVKKMTIGETKAHHESQILDILIKHEISLICLAGYMRLLSSKFIAHFYDRKIRTSRIINIHPSILPSFKGANAYLDAFNYGVKMSGVTMHFVDSGMDSGPILLQDSFKRFDDDTVDEFIQRGLEVEHRLYRNFLRDFATLKIHPIILPEGRMLITFSPGEEYAALV